MTETTYAHDCRPYLSNPLLVVHEYDYAAPKKFADWPKAYRHPLGCKIEYDAEAVRVATLAENRDLLDLVTKGV